MRKLAVVTGAAIALAGTWTALAGPSNNLDTRPQANAYISVDFGHPQPAKATRAPFHYGLRMSYDNRLRANDGGDLPALAAFDFDNRGNRLASFGGVPFAGRIAPPLRQNEDGSVGGGEAGGLTFFDLGLMIAGAAGVGYLIFEVARNDQSPPVPAGTTGGATGGASGGLLGGTLGGLLGGASGGLLGGASGGLLGGASGGLLGGASGGLLGGTSGGLLGGVTGGATGYAGTGDRIAADRDVERLNWLDGGTGQMGDLQAAPKR